MKKVLICPLNWGLGHATRCIPIAREFQQQGYEVDFASDGGPLEFLRMEFPMARFHQLPGYGVTYPTTNFIFNIGRRMIRLLQVVRDEHRIIQKIASDEAYDIVVSDNRYGCYSTISYNIFITHQVNIMTPGNVLDPAVNAINHRFIRKYDVCWIPDFEVPPGLSGDLGHDHPLTHAVYIGPVSRLVPSDTSIKYKLTAVLSGPEPQRSKLENEIRDQFAGLPYPTALVGGVVLSHEKKLSTGDMDYFPFLTSQELNKVMAQSEIIVCRGGYTTIMDLLALGKKAICIPTPGQPEQEYLTQIYDDRGCFLRQEQGNIDLNKALKEIEGYSGFQGNIQSGLLTRAVAMISQRQG
ncbi:MAG TPA: glycosyltransferase [Membranihabitans sp.]|nr:glycosyltransferase [Membranihabitans sp.]